MELIDGVTLRAWLDAEPRGVDAIQRAFHAAGAGLGALHDAGLVHRDFKSDNVMVAGDRVIVMDLPGALCLRPMAVEAEPSIENAKIAAPGNRSPRSGKHQPMARLDSMLVVALCLGAVGCGERETAGDSGAEGSGELDWGEVATAAAPIGALACDVGAGCGLDCITQAAARPYAMRFLEVVADAGYSEAVALYGAKLSPSDGAHFLTLDYLLVRDGFSTPTSASWRFEGSTEDDIEPEFVSHMQSIDPRWAASATPLDDAAILAALGECNGSLPGDYDPCEDNTESLRIITDTDDVGSCGRPLAIADLDPITVEILCDLSPEESCGED